MNVVVELIVYLLPTIIVLARHGGNAKKVVLIDVLLGWTIVGWIVALVMAIRGAQPAKPHKPSKAEQAQAARDAAIQAFMAADLAPCSAPGFVLHAGETCYYTHEAREVEDVTTHTYVGGYAGRRLGHSSLRLGGFAGRSIASTRPREIDRGTLTLTNLRSVFVGAHAAKEVKVDKIVMVHAFADGVRLDISNKPYVTYITGEMYASLTLARITSGQFKGSDVQITAGSGGASQITTAPGTAENNEGAEPTGAAAT